ncbi:hypothetical protein EZS27_042265, partial [termite gut metagenome]
KKRMKKMIITITDNGTVTVSDKVKMNISEIADLFGIFHQTAKGVFAPLRNPALQVATARCAARQTN